MVDAAVMADDMMGVMAEAICDGLNRDVLLVASSPAPTLDSLLNVAPFMASSGATLLDFILSLDDDVLASFVVVAFVLVEVGSLTFIAFELSSLVMDASRAAAPPFG